MFSKLAVFLSICTSVSGSKFVMDHLMAHSVKTSSTFVGNNAMKTVEHPVNVLSNEDSGFIEVEESISADCAGESYLSYYQYGRCITSATEEGSSIRRVNYEHSSDIYTIEVAYYAEDDCAGNVTSTRSFEMTSECIPGGPGQRYYGKVLGLVTEIDTPKGYYGKIVWGMDEQTCTDEDYAMGYQAHFFEMDTCFTVVGKPTFDDDFYGAMNAKSFEVKSCGEARLYESTDCSGDYTTSNEQANIDECEIDNDSNYYSYYCNDKKSSSSKGVCFAGSETVLFESGEVKLISEVAVGDRVQVPGGFSEVVAVPHGRNEIPSTFVEITTGFGDSVKMSPAHVISAGSCGSSSLPLVYAENVNVGDCVMTASGTQAVVSSTKMVEGKGLYSFVTREEFIVVGNIVTSPFAVNHAVANMFYNIHRALPSGSPLLKVFSAVAQKVAELASSPLVMSLVGSV